jgi:pimeloyl-ACP methyl ester carboxylesterase
VYPFDLGIPARILGAAQDCYEIAVCSVDGRPVETNAGFSLTPQSGPEIIETADTTIVAPVDPTRLTRDVPEAVAAALARRSPGTRVASICTGGFLLAAAGILNGRSATTHWECATLFRRWYPDIALDEGVLLVDDGDVVDLAGVGGSSGTTPNTIEEMAYNAFAFLDAIGLDRYDLLGFSIGGFIAQEAVLLRPWQVRRLILAGTAPRGGPDIHIYTAGPIRETAFADDPGPRALLTLFFEKSTSSQAAGVEFLKRLGRRTAERDAPTTLAVRNAMPPLCARRYALFSGWCCGRRPPATQLMSHDREPITQDKDINVPFAATIGHARRYMRPGSILRRHFPESMVAASMSVSAADRAWSSGEVSLSDVASALAPSKSTAI